ncbi:MAG: disulfide reductase [Chloroflexi bacterium RBG_13_53_26]|nr:MAG: disulfide reductase [Chloroflexi bacterium RBG_13_53_26]
MDVSIYPGCSLDGTAKEYGESLEAITSMLGVNLHELKDWNCCGASSAHSMNNDLAVALAARNLGIADQMGMDLVVPCAACYQRLKVAEKRLVAGEKLEGVDNYDGKIHIKPLVDFLWDDVGEKQILSLLKKRLEGLNPVCYYGCLTARPPKITDAKSPENPMSMDEIMTCLGANVRQWSYKTDCCGGSLILTRPDIARTLIRKLLDMAEEAGADCVVAACPMCQSNLDGRQREISQESGKEYNVPIFYFTELMGLACGNPSVKKWLGRHVTDPRPLLTRKSLV